VQQLKTATQQLTSLDATLKSKDLQLTAASRTADTLAAGLRDAESRARELKAQADLVPGLQGDVKKLREHLFLAEGRIVALEKDLAAARDELSKAEDGKGGLARDLTAQSRELAAARAQVEQLQGETRRLSEAAARIRQAADNRFAGIALSGRRVVFVVDMSGSMDLLDDRTLAPGKWQGVRETLAQVFRSLPDVEKYQVIVFSERANYLLGNPDRWFDFDPNTSVNVVTEALAATKPNGNTNIYAALELAFRFRAQGLDTIYFLSDGLPNVGEGLGVNANRPLREAERTELLSRHVRRTLLTDWNRPLPNQPRVRIHTIGFFYESPDVGAFLWALSRENDGSFVGMSQP
jgi:hypothetical protein